MSVLITGGAGYVGSHAVLAFREAGYDVVVIDDLSTGRRDAVGRDVPFIEGDAGDINAVREVMSNYRVDSVVHFAGSIVVPESVTRPLDYYRNNGGTSRNLIQACVEGGVERFIFSSTAAVYGMPRSLPVSEDAPTVPINPYGRSKLLIEWMLEDAAAAHDLRYVSLRYFNVAGADPAGRTGQSSPNATHLIKVASEAVVGRRPYVQVFGEDYDTPDGTCIRDYIHVTDLVDAHVQALRYLESGGASQVLNCGYGHGCSVKEVLRAVEAAAGRPLDIRSAPRRPGDAPALVADASRIRRTLQWRPGHNSLKEIVETAVRWERTLAAR